MARWEKGFAFAGPAPARSAGADSLSPFLAFVGEMARRFEAKAPPRRSTAFRREVEAKLKERLAGGEANVDSVASALGLSRQTLYRRLKAEGATFEQLLDELRRRLALRYVGREGMSAKAAAWRLGFSDPAAFSRAFKRWTGTSPSEYRSRR